jgi:hypothetical protein
MTLLHGGGGGFASSLSLEGESGRDGRGLSVQGDLGGGGEAGAHRCGEASHGGGGRAVADIARHVIGFDLANVSMSSFSMI